MTASLLTRKNQVFRFSGCFSLHNTFKNKEQGDQNAAESKMDMEKTG